MKLHEIIAANENPSMAISYEKIHPYKKLLFAYYSAQFPKHAEPVLIVLSLSNAVQYCKIAPSNEIIETICDYLDDHNCADPDSENFSTYEQIMANSKLLENII